MVISVSETSQQHEDNEQQRHNEMDSMHQCKGEGAITQSNGLSCFLLSQQTPQTLCLENDETDSDSQRLHHPAAKNPLSFAADIKTGGLKNHASNQQQERAEDEGGRKPKVSHCRGE